MTKPRYSHSVNFDAAGEERLQSILKRTKFNFAELIRWGMEQAEDRLNKKEGK